MIKYFITKSGARELVEIAEPQKGCWIHLEAPNAEEIAFVSSVSNVEEEHFKTALDIEESAHVTVDGKTRMIVIDIPKTIGNEQVSTMPLTMIENDNYLITICTVPTAVLEDFFRGRIKGVDTAYSSKLIYQIILNNSSRFLYYLRRIDKDSDYIQKGLARSMKNKELLELLEIQKSLVFFSASLSANYAVIQKISSNANLVKATEDERDILEDVNIETKQALDMCSVYREIIKSTMDAFASIVNNNQNIIMKFLTAITIILSIPMVIAGLWGMNTGVPFEGEAWGFWAAIGIAFVISIIVTIFMARRRMF